MTSLLSRSYTVNLLFLIFNIKISTFLLFIMQAVGNFLPLKDEVKQRFELVTIKGIYSDWTSKNLAECRASKWSKMKSQPHIYHLMPIHIIFMLKELTISALYFFFIKTNLLHHHQTIMDGQR